METTVHQTAVSSKYELFGTKIEVTTTVDGTRKTDVEKRELELKQAKNMLLIAETMYRAAFIREKFCKFGRQEATNLCLAQGFTSSDIDDAL